MPPAFKAYLTTEYEPRDTKMCYCNADFQDTGLEDKQFSGYRKSLIQVNLS